MPDQFDAAIELQLDILRTSRRLTAEAVADLRDIEKKLIAEVAAGNYSQWRKSRLDRQIRDVRAMLHEDFKAMGATISDKIGGIAEVSASATAASIGPSAVLPPASVINTIATTTVVDGALQVEWWNRQAETTAFRFSQAVRQGMTEGRTNQQIIATVRGFIDVSRRDAAALVQTATASVANRAREATFERNLDVIKRYRAVATLDTHTCPTCAPLDGLEWKPDGTKVGGHKFPLPAYPLHMNCRCLLVPIVLDGDLGGTRASDGGQVDGNLTFAGWLRRQSTEKQDEILGKGRAELYRKGTITLTDLVTASGNPLTLEQLRAKYL